MIETFETHRSKLIGLAYRITGSRAEAEDIVQETFLKWLHYDHKTINSVCGWLMKIATRLALDYVKSARVKRVSYIGSWLPEPFVEGDGESGLEVAINTSPDKQLELDESISMALLVVLESLSPAQRASFILHDLFHLDFKEIGVILGKTSDSCRKLASRARLKIGQDGYDIQAKKNTDEHLQIVSAFFHAVKDGDITRLVSLLKENVILHADGGGKAIALLDLLKGSKLVVEFFLDKVRPDFIASKSNNVAIGVVWFNGSPGLIVRHLGKPVTAFNFEIEAGEIKKIHALRNPDKLRLFTHKKRPIAEQ